MGLSPDRDPASSPVYAAVTEPYRRCPSTDAVQRAEYADLKVYLPNDPLVKVDRMSMAHGLEVRCPLLDRRVVELAFRIPASRKQIGRQGKALLRALAQTRLPKGLWRLPKRGFTAPIGQLVERAVRGAVPRRGAAIRIRSVGDYLDRQDLARRFDVHRRQRGRLQLRALGDVGPGALASDRAGRRETSAVAERLKPLLPPHERGVGQAECRSSDRDQGTSGRNISQLSGRLLSHIA